MNPASRSAIERLRVPAMLAGAAVLVTLAAAPLNLWFLAWVGLAPLFVAVSGTRRARHAALEGWLAGAGYFALNLWWLWPASIPGAVLIVLIFACYGAAAMGVLRWLRWLRPADAADVATSTDGRRAVGVAGRIVGIAAVWVGCEWLRCRLFVAFPWLPLGATQSPVVAMCQVADLGGPWIVSFWVALVNAGVAIAWVERAHGFAWRTAGAVTVAALAATAGYGTWRLATTETTPGPRVMVLQSNFPTLRGGESAAEPDRLVRFYLGQLRVRMATKPADLVILPEAAFPPLNEEARSELATGPVGPFLRHTYGELADISRESGAALLVGGDAVTAWHSEGAARVGGAIHNSAYFFDPTSPGRLKRYDKIHLVPFCESAPCAQGPARLRRLGLAIAANRAAQPLTAGELDELQPLRLTWRPPDSSVATVTPFIAPICLEAIDPAVVAAMMRRAGGAAGKPSFLAVVSSDGWFAAQEKEQHFQLLVFRAIEHRTPIARCSNTGVSGFIDSVGRVGRTLPPYAADAAIERLALDERQTIYARYGDVFVAGCGAFAAVGAARRLFEKRKAC
jgi:apolipoprotein N-acyltransferase